MIDTTITVDAETLKNIQEVSLDAARFKEMLPILNTYLRKQHGCILGQSRIDVIVVSVRDGKPGKRLLQTTSFAIALEFALKQEIAHA